MNTNSNVYTVIYSTVLVVVVAAILAFAAEGLKDKQNENVKLETITKVLTAAAQADDNFSITEDTDILATYRDKAVDAYYIDCDGNKVGESMNLGKEDLKAIQVASTSDLKKQNDIIKKVEAGNADAAKELRLPVYVFDIAGKTVTVIPCYGAGLWGPVWGYLAFDETIRARLRVWARRLPKSRSTASSRVTSSLTTVTSMLSRAALAATFTVWMQSPERQSLQRPSARQSTLG